MNESPMVSVENLRYSYGAREALAGVSFSVAPGEIFGLLGPNGSGKSTLFRVLATLLEPAAGAVRLAGLDPARSLHEIRRKIGVVFQTPSVDDKLTVLENLKYHGYLYGWSGKRLGLRCRELVERVGLADRTGELAGKLSGGLRRRVEIAKGLLNRPAILLLDEPSTGLDPGARIDLWRHLRSLRKEEGVTVLVTTHWMDEADYCDRIAILSEGRLVCAGEPAALRREIGSDIVEIKSDRAADLAKKIGGKFRLKTFTDNGTVRVEHAEGARFVAQVAEAFPGLVDAVTFRRPTLEDVYLSKTGHRFWNGEGGEKA